jgi:nitronate monooxygenase
VQRALTAAMRAAALAENDLERMQAWAGQAAAMAREQPAARVVEQLWRGAQQLLGMP